MTALTDLEINKRLALAIGYLDYQIRVVELPRISDTDYIIVNRPGDPLGPWRRFDYRDPAVIWPIAERYKSFPQHVSYGANKEWRVLSGQSGGPIYANTAAKAVALAVIGAKK